MGTDEKLVQFQLVFGGFGFSNSVINDRSSQLSNPYIGSHKNVPARHFNATILLATLSRSQNSLEPGYEKLNAVLYFMAVLFEVIWWMMDSEG